MPVITDPETGVPGYSFDVDENTPEVEHEGVIALGDTSTPRVPRDPDEDDPDEEIVENEDDPDVNDLPGTGEEADEHPDPEHVNV